jgi:hypothetical protein
MESGTVRIDISDDDLDIKDTVYSTFINRVSFAIIIVGLLIASVLILDNGPTGWLLYSALIALALDVFFIFVLLGSIYRSGRL